jgi:hypothetical protein
VMSDRLDPGTRRRRSISSSPSTTGEEAAVVAPATLHPRSWLRSGQRRPSHVVTALGVEAEEAAAMLPLEDTIPNLIRPLLDLLVGRKQRRRMGKNHGGG